MKKIVCLCLFVIILAFDYLVILSEVEESHFCFAQNPEWLTFITNNNINTIESEADDLWIGTFNGLLKMNIVTKEHTFYQTYFSELPSDRIYSLMKSENNIIWVGTDNGLAKFDGKDWIVYNDSNSGLTSNSIRVIERDKSGILWLGTEKGLVKYDGSNWTVYDGYKSEFEYYYVGVMTIDSNYNIWIGNSYGLAKFDGLNWTVYKKNNSGLPDTSIRALTTDKNGNVWIGTYDGAVKFDGSNWTVFDTSNSDIIDNSIYSLTVDNNNNICIGTYYGISIYNGVTWKKLDLKIYYDKYPIVYYLKTDKIGNIWIVGSEGRLFLYDGYKVIDFNYPYEGLPNGNIKSLLIDKSNNVWMGSSGFLGSGLTKFDGRTWYKFSKIDSNIYILGDVIAIDSNDCIWTNHYRGIIKLYNGNWEAYGSQDTNVKLNFYGNGLSIDKYNNKWFGTYGYGLIKFDGSNWTVYNKSNSEIPTDYIFSTAIDRDQNVWLGTLSGLIKFDGVNWVVYNSENTGFAGNRIYSISIDTKNNIWIGGNNVFAKFDGTNWIIFDSTNSDFSKGEYSTIAFEKDSIVWVGNNSSIIKYDGYNNIIYDRKNSPINYRVNKIAVDQTGNKWIATGYNIRMNDVGTLIVFREGGVILDVLSEPEDNDYTKSNSKNYPNPFQYTTNIEYELENAGNINIDIYNMQGELVRKLFSGYVDGGKHTAMWNGKTEEGKEVENGIYIYKVQFEGNVITGKMVLIK